MENQISKIEELVKKTNKELSHLKFMYVILIILLLWSFPSCVKLPNDTAQYYYTYDMKTGKACHIIIMDNTYYKY